MTTNLIMKPGWQQSGIACTSPAVPDVGGPVRYGYLTGIALTHEGEGGNAAGQCTVDFGPGVWDLSVIDHGGAGIALGASLFLVDGAPATIENDTTGYFFGFALETVGAGLTATIKVFHCPSPGAGTLGAGVIGTAHLAAGLISADPAGRALFAAGVFNAATALSVFGADSIDNAFLLDAVLNGAFQNDAATRALFADRIWTEDKIALAALTGTVAAIVADANVIGGIPLLYRIEIADASGNTDVVVTHKIRVLDVWLRSSGIAAHATDDHVQLINVAAPDAITNEIAKTATINSVVHCSTIDPAHEEIAAGAVMRATAVKVTNVACTLYVLAVRVA